MKYFSFKSKIWKFPLIWEKLKEEPFAIKYKKEDGTKIPAIIFRYNKKFFVILFGYWKRKNFSKILTQKKAIEFWKKRKFSHFTPLIEYLTDEEKTFIKELKSKIKPKIVIRKRLKIIIRSGKKEKEKEIRKFLLQIGKRIGLHKLTL
ncbi:hypothetical protein J7K86_01320 [bacterium]|nr:hypothetical protein [bacterium]